MGGYTSKCEKKSKSLHPSVQCSADFCDKSRWQIFLFSILEVVPTAIKKNPGKEPPAMVIFVA